MYNSMFEYIKKYSNMKKLSFFIGAGVSKVSGFPSWVDLVKSMGDEINYTYDTYTNEKGEDVINLQADEFLKIPEMYYAKFSENRYLEKVKDAFAKSVSPNKVHDLIMAFHPNHILTTNYDTLIEETAIKFGENYSVIASDQDISKAETIKYLLKVHGDFSTKFVLKESDYLNYDYNYQLIINLMKSIFATNLVIFIGYGLNDYNIKLILNWVYNLQKENFIKPIFINTDSPISNIERDYYSNRGIRIIDSNDFVDTTSNHLTKYIETLKKVITFSLNPELSDKETILKLIHNKINGIKNLSYIKRSDFNKMFYPDFIVNNDWKIEHRVNSRLNNFWKDYFDNKLGYMKIDFDKSNAIDSFIQQCQIRGVKSGDNLYFPKINIENLSFNGLYNEMINYCNFEYNQINDNYKKAYYLSQIGKLEESYNLFTELLKECKTQKEWDIYYLSQVNRKQLFSSIKQVRRYYQSPISILETGRLVYVVNEEFYHTMDREMEYHNAEIQFDELPHQFKNNYNFLNNYCKNNCFLKEIDALLKDKYDVEKQLISNTISTGLSKFDKIKLEMLEAYKFIQDNMILVDGYKETKNYIKNAMLIWLQGHQKEITKKSTDIFGNIRNAVLIFTAQDIIILSKNCVIDDLKHFEKMVAFNSIPFEERGKLIEYITRIIDFYQSNFNKEFLDTEYLLWREFCTQIKSLLYISSYFIKEKNCINMLVNFIYTNKDSHFRIWDRLNIIRRYVNIETANSISSTLEEWIIMTISKYLTTPNEKYLMDIEEISEDILLISKQHEFKAIKLSEKILQLNSEDKAIINSLIKLSNILNEDAKNIVLQEYNVNDVWALIEKYKIDSTIDLSKYKYLITDYFEKTIEKNNINGVNNVFYGSVLPQECCIQKIIFFIIENKIQIDGLDKYKGNWSEFDFMFVSELFDVNNFDSVWLLFYSDEILEYIKSSEIRVSIVKNSLKQLDKSMCREYIERWFYLFENFT